MKRLVCYILVLTAISLCQAQEKPLSNRVTPTVQAVANALPWVVNIGTEALVKVNDGYDDFFTDFYFFKLRRMKQKVVKEYNPLGSGIIIDSRGFVLTNLHVVKRAHNIEIRLWNGMSYKGELIGFDAPNDLCLIRMVGGEMPKDLKTAPFAKPDDVLLGESVITIGNPFGLEHSVSQGVLSAINRSYEDDTYPFNDILQTDAAINPGNSGGPLINLDGELIGINQAIRKNASGIGFAIPIKRIEQFLSHWLLPCRFSNAYLGISPTTQLETGKHGIILTDIIPDSPAARAGLKAGDEITSVNGHATPRLIDFGRAVCLTQNNEKVIITLADNRKLKLTAERMPPQLLIQTRLGIQVQELTPALCDALDLRQDLKGLVINEMTQEIPFASHNESWRDVVKRGDIIMKVNNKELKSQQDLVNWLNNSRSGQSLDLLILCFEHQRQSLVALEISTCLY